MWTPKTERCAFLVDNLDLPAASGVPDARWEHFQIDHLEDDGDLRCELKARQIAASFTYSAEAVANAYLGGISSIFQSINLEEAREKIIYARAVIENLSVKGPKITQPDTTTSLGFSNGARILSLPGTPQRGKARFWVYLDEWAWQKHDRANYTAAFPVISKGGKLRGASSPSGSNGLFWEIFKQELRPYSGYTRKQTPWWEVQAFCIDVATARWMSPTLSTKERVERFGRDRIKLIYENMPDEDFYQEYECQFVDESSAWITWEEIKALQALHAGPCLIVECKGSKIDRAKEIIDALLGEIREYNVERVLTAGVDIGRTRNTTELLIGGASTLDQYPLRAMITLDNCEFDDQFEVLTYAIRVLPIKKMLIDRNGLGMMLAENMAKKFPGKAEGVDFTNSTKELWATNAKMLAQKKQAPIPINRPLAYQIHSIKRKVTPSKNLVFDTEKNEKHHADKFWGWALQLAAATDPLGKPKKPVTLAQGKTKGWQPRR